MGQEFKGKGVHVALGPMMNMGRIAQGGRNWEGFGADPFLSGEAAYETILVLQAGGVQACAKHYINKYALRLSIRDSLLTESRCSEQEHFRTQESSNVDDRTEHEIYFHPFLRSVQAGVASVLCSYSQYSDLSPYIVSLLVLVCRPDKRHILVRERLHAQRAPEEAGRLPRLCHD